MSSVFSPYATSFHCSSDRSDQLTHSPRAGHDLHSPLSHSRLQSDGRTDPPAHSYDCATACLQCTAPPVEPRRMTPTGRRRNQGGFYGII